jgi:hypothetical protein
MEGVGTSERMALAEPRYESENLGSDRDLREILPIGGEPSPELLELGREQ